MNARCSMWTLAMLVLPAAAVEASPLILTGIFDAPDGGQGIEIFVTQDVSDLSQFALGRGTNGRLISGTGDSSPTLVLSGQATAGTFLYAVTRSDRFKNFFGLDADFVSTNLSFNGDDAAGILVRDATTTSGWSLLDVFGTQDNPATTPAPDQAWNYEDSWFYRKDGSSARTTFLIDEWFFPVTGNAQTDHWDFAGETNGSNGTEPFPLGTFDVPEPASIALLASGGVFLLRRRKA